MADRCTGVLRPLAKRFPCLLGNQDLHRKLRHTLPKTSAACCFMTLVMQCIIGGIIATTLLFRSTDL